MIVSFLVFHSFIEVFQGFVVVCFFTKFFKSYGYQVLKLIEVGLDIVHNCFVELWKCFKLRGDVVHFVIIIEFLLIKFLVLFFQLESILFLIQENVGSL